MNRQAKTLIRQGGSGSWGRFLLAVSFAGIVVVASPSALAQHERGLLERIGDFFGGADEVEEVADGIEIAVGMAANGAEPAPKEVSARQKRLDAWCLAWEESLVTSLELSDEQRSDVKKLFIKHAAMSQQKWKRQQQQQRQQQGVPDTTVALFAGSQGPAAPIVKALARAMPKLLNDGQIAEYAKIQATREHRVVDWYSRRASAIIDAELFLTDEQLAACQEDVRIRIAGSRSNGLYAFHQQSHYLPYEQLGQFIRRFKKLELTPVQKRRWTDLRGAGQNHNNHVMVTVNAESDEENEKQIDAACRTARKRYFNAAAVRSEYLTTSLQLPQNSARYLEVAGKGVAVRSLNTWKKQTRTQIKQFADNPQFGFRAGNQQIGLRGPSIQPFEQDRLWKNAVEKVTVNGETDILKQHDQRILDGATAFVMATLDRELHLDDDQAEGLRQLVLEAEPHEVSSQQLHWLELAMVARVFGRVDEKLLADLMNEPQLECWKLMKAQFRFQGKDTATFTTQHGEQHLMLTRPNENNRNARGVDFF